MPGADAPSSDRAAVGVPLVRQVIRGRLGRLFGGRAFDIETDAGDRGLTGPGSASWRVIAEPAAIVGGIRGLVLQVAHPLAVAGVHDHSAFRSDPLGRLHRTSAYVSTTTFGSVREALEATARVRAVHPRVHGMAPDGRRYRADDPQLLAWVGIALTSSFLAADRCWAPNPVTGGDADAFVEEQSRIAALLDPRVDLEALRRDRDARQELAAGRFPLPMIDEGTLPTSVRGLERALARYGAELGIDEQGRDALRFLQHPPLPLGVSRPYRVLLRGAIGSLSPAERAALEFDVGATTARRWIATAGMVVTAIRLGSGTSPSERVARERVAASRDGQAHPHV